MKVDVTASTHLIRNGRAPVIGITAGADLLAKAPETGLNLAKYVAALSSQGASAVIIPPGSSADVVRRLDGLMLPGGGDVAPRLYGARRHPRTAGVSNELDDLEVKCVQCALELGKPVLGICRGQQMINVVLGGTLHQHLPAHPASHMVQIGRRTLLHSAVGAERLKVYSGHHQAVARVADGLLVSASSDEGDIEALESEDGLILSVQWHPEESLASAASAGLFRLFVAKVRSQIRREPRRSTG
jgi:putative glutamine amidotransferase